MDLDSRPIVWLASNLKHIERDHPERAITRADVEEVLADPRRSESIERRKGTEEHTVIGETSSGRLLVIVWVDHENGRLPIHARRAGRRAAKEYYE